MFKYVAVMLPVAKIATWGLLGIPTVSDIFNAQYLSDTLELCGSFAAILFNPLVATLGLT